MKGKKKPPAVDPMEQPLEFLGWLDEDGEFHPDNQGNRYIFSASGYDWRAIYGLRK